MHNYVFYLIIIFPLFGYLVARILDYLNGKMWSPELPEKLKGICDEDQYSRSQLYYRENNRLSFWSSTFNIVLIISMIAWGGFAFIDNLSRGFSNHMVLVSLVFFGIIGIGSEIVNIPFTWYDNFIIEKKYGFNTMKIRTFITDHLKSWFLAVLIGGPVLGAITWLYYRIGTSFWIYAWLLITLFSVFMNLFYSELIVPLFNKQTPLEPGELREMIESFAAKTGFQLRNIYVIDGSKRSTKANAYFSGFGPKKRIVLFDTLMKEFTNDEIVAVLAHEIGHYRKKHVIKGLISSVVLSGFMLFLFSLVVDSPVISGAMGAESSSFHMGLIVFGILYSPLSLIIGLISNYISRRNEYEADRFVKENHKAEVLAGALKKLSVKNLSNMLPHPAYVFFHYSHPPLLERLEKLE